MGRSRHLTHYIILFVGLGLAVTLLLLFRLNRSLKLVTGAFGALFYVGWGIIHHALEDRLSKEVITEYILFGILAFLMLFFALSI